MTRIQAPIETHDTPPSARVVLVDDSWLILELIGEQLQEAGWQVRLATRGSEALTIIRAWPPDAVVCDLHMPEMEGLEVMRRIHTSDPTLPVVVLSGDADLSAVLGAVRQGAFDYVLKDGADIRPLQAALGRAAMHARLARENLRLTGALQQANDELETRVRELDEKHRLLEQAQAQSEALLRNILPDVVVARLKEDDQVIADGFAEATVLFADIVGFTRLAADRTPIAMVELLNEIFSRFDHLVEQYGLEKIKTIGDAYMAASGLPVPRPDHAEAAASLALDMLRVIAELRTQIGEPVGVRIGMHSGPVVAGVIGTKKFIYDVWGDTVNVASRMEACGVPGRIQVTDQTRVRLEHLYMLEERGLIEVKGKGRIRTWFLTGFLSGHGSTP